MVIQTKEKARKPDDFDGMDTANYLYGSGKKRTTKIEKVPAPRHWNKDFKPKHQTQKDHD